MMRRLATLFISLPLLAASIGPREQAEPTVRIGLNQNAGTVTIRSSQAFAVESNRTRSAKFTPIVSVDPAAKTVTKDDLQYRMLVELEGGKMLALPMTSKVRLEPAGAWMEFDNRSYRGILEVFGNARNSFTVVNELPMEEYLLGVVPNELGPTTFGKLEALKAQAVAARTYIVRNMGQYRRDGFDICNTDACQVYFGAGTEDPLATQAVNETRGLIAAYNYAPIQAFIRFTCGGRTEDAANIFDERLPYLKSVICEYKHPDPKRFSSLRSVPDWKDGVLRVAGVSNFTELRRFIGISGTGEPTGIANTTGMAKWIRANFYPNVKPPSDVEFLTQQGILSPTRLTPPREILFQLIDKKSAFEWQQGVLSSWDGKTATLIVNNAPVEFKIRPDALIYQRIGEERLPMKEGMWVGGELLDFRANAGTIE